MLFAVLAILTNFCVFAFAEDVKSVLEGLGVKGKKNALSFKVYDHDFKATLTDIEYAGFSEHNDALLSLHVKKSGSTDAGWDVKLVTHYKESNNQLTFADRSPYKDDKRELVKAMYPNYMRISAPEGLTQACSTKGKLPVDIRHSLGTAIRGAISAFKIWPILEAKKLVGKPKGITIRMKAPAQGPAATATRLDATIVEFDNERIPVDCVSITAQLFDAAGNPFRYMPENVWRTGSEEIFVRVLVHRTAASKLELAKPPTSTAAPEDSFTDGVPLVVLARFAEVEEKFWKFYLDTTPKPDQKSTGSAGKTPNTPAKSWKISGKQRREIADAFVAALNARQTLNSVFIDTQSFQDQFENLF